MQCDNPACYPLHYDDSPEAFVVISVKLVDGITFEEFLLLFLFNYT